MNYLLTVTSLLFVLFPWSCSSWIPNNNPQRFALSSSQQQQQQERSTASSLAATKATTLDGKEIRGPITPLGNMILVRIKDTLTSTEGGILLPDQAQERPTEGVVIEAGPGKLHPFTGVRITNPIRKGVSVVFGKYEGTPVNYNDEDCQMIRDDNVLLYYEGARMKLDNVVPVRDYVLVQLDEAKDTLQTSSGVVIAAAVQKDQTQCEGVVVKVGEGRMASLGNITPSPVQEGDRVKFKDYAGNELSIEGKPFAVVKMVDILSSLNEE